MRIIFEGYAIYVAIIVTLLTAILAFNLSDEAIIWVAKKVINISALVFGPLLFTLCAYRIYHFKALSKVCGLKGIEHNEFNYVCIILVAVFCLVGLAVTFFLANQKTMDMAHESFNNLTSILFSATYFYF